MTDQVRINKCTVVQYLPDVVSGERVNIGVIVYGEEGVRVHFLQNWQRVKAFSRKNIKFLKDFAKEVSSAASSMHMDVPGDPALTVAQITGMVKNWRNSIQLTEPRGGTLDLQTLLAQSVSRYLVEPEHGVRPYRNRQSAAKLAADAIESAMRSVRNLTPTTIRHLIARDAELQGSLMPQEFDVVARNGQPYFAAQGISFEIADLKDLRDHVKLMTFAINDVKQGSQSLPIGVVALPPAEVGSAESSDLYGEACDAFGRAGAQVVSESGVHTWAIEAVRTTIPVDIAFEFEQAS